MQARDFNLSQEEYDIHKKLINEKVETSIELRQAESRYLAKKLPLIQTESNRISLINEFSKKEIKILELDNTIIEEKSKSISTTRKNEFTMFPLLPL